jgi:leucyl-tRNA synthetase
MQLLQPFAPHLAEELWAKLHSAFSLQPSALAYAPWPKHDPALLVENTLEIPVQIDGRVRNIICIPVGSGQQVYIQTALQDEKVQQFLIGREIKKQIVVPNKMVSLVTGVAPGADGKS